MSALAIACLVEHVSDLVARRPPQYTKASTLAETVYNLPGGEALGVDLLAYVRASEHGLSLSAWEAAKAVLSNLILLRAIARMSVPPPGLRPGSGPA